MVHAPRHAGDAGPAGPPRRGRTQPLRHGAWARRRAGGPLWGQFLHGEPVEMIEARVSYALAAMLARGA